MAPAENSNSPPPQEPMDVDDVNDRPFSDDGEALEERGLNDDEEEKEASEGSGEDLMENMEDDYRAVEQLDRYEDKDIDDADQEVMEEADRQAVD